MEKRADALHSYMSELCQQAFGAKWIDHLEFVLWHSIVAGPLQYGKLTISHAHIARLRELSDQCGGWIYFERDVGLRLVPLIAWQDIYTSNFDAVKLGRL